MATAPRFHPSSDPGASSSLEFIRNNTLSSVPFIVVKMPNRRLQRTKQARTHNATKPIFLIEIPPELRIKIYELVSPPRALHIAVQNGKLILHVCEFRTDMPIALHLTGDHNYCTSHYRISNPTNEWLINTFSLFKTCKKFWQKDASLPYMRTIFIFDDYEAFHVFKESLKPYQREYLRDIAINATRVRIERTMIKKPSIPLPLKQQFSGLKHLSLYFNKRGGFGGFVESFLESSARRTKVLLKDFEGVESLRLDVWVYVWASRFWGDGTKFVPADGWKDGTKEGLARLKRR